MRSTVRPSRLATLAAFAAAGTLVLAGVTPASAFQHVTFVSVSGDDGNNCGSPQEACFSLQAAYDQSVDGGQINIIDGGHYAGIVISKSITINGEAAKDAVIHNGFSIETEEGEEVMLRGLVVETACCAAINYRGSGSLQVEGCVIDGTRSGLQGVVLFPTGEGRVSIADTVVRNFAFPGSAGLLLEAEKPDPIRLSLERVSLVGNDIGMRIVAQRGDGVKAVVRDSIVAQNGVNSINGGNGIEVSGLAFSDVLIERTAVVGNGLIGVHSEGNATVRLRTATVTHNGTGIDPKGILSYGDNVIDANGTNGTPTEVGTLK